VFHSAVNRSREQSKKCPAWCKPRCVVRYREDLPSFYLARLAGMEVPAPAVGETTADERTAELTRDLFSKVGEHTVMM
jgi:hypothetical protein